MAGDTFRFLCLPFLTNLSRSCKKLVMLRFLQKFFAAFPQYQNTNFYVFGESYAGQLSFPPWYCGGEPCVTSWDKDARAFTPKLDLARFFPLFQGFSWLVNTRIPIFPTDHNKPKFRTSEGKVYSKLLVPGHYVPAIGHRIWSGNKARFAIQPPDTAVEP